MMIMWLGIYSTNFVSKVIKSYYMPHWVERTGVFSKINTALTTSEVLNVSHRHAQ